MNNKIIQVINQYGTPFNVKVVEKGESYGRKGCLIHDRDDALVEFYDATHIEKFDDWKEGQFVTSYYASTMLECEDGYGLCLYGGVDSWVVSASNMIVVKKMLEELGY